VSTPAPREAAGDQHEGAHMAGRGTAVVTGASSGIGAACAARLATGGWDVVVGARRIGQLEAVAVEIGGRALPLDVTDPSSVEAFAAQVTGCTLVVNNAGGAIGLEPVAEAELADWQSMYDSNVLGVVRVTQALLPQLVASARGHVVTIGSIAGLEAYPGGGGYNAAKHAVRAVMEVLRMELLGQPVRVTEIDPGMVETEFSVVRFRGDEARAAAVYEGVEALTAEDVAECVGWAAELPDRVNIDRIVVKPRDQAGARMVHRRSAT